MSAKWLREDNSQKKKKEKNQPYLAPVKYPSYRDSEPVFVGGQYIHGWAIGTNIGDLIDVQLQVAIREMRIVCHENSREMPPSPDDRNPFPEH